MMKIVPCVWFDGTAAKAARVYVSAFRDAHILDESVMEDTPSGDAELINIQISGQPFTLLSAGPEFRPNPSISFLISCNSTSEVDRLWADLSPYGKELMPLGVYPFSPRYGWIEDRFGISWQLFFAQNRGPRPKIIPTFMFTGDVCGKAQEAMRFWTSVFEKSSMGDILTYGEEESSDAPGTVKHGEFTLEGQLFSAMDSAAVHDFGFTEGLSLQVRCQDQGEIDRLWQALSARPEDENCGWLKDKYGVSWQITPLRLEEMITNGDPERRARVVQRVLKMKKIDIAELEQSYKD